MMSHALGSVLLLCFACGRIGYDPIVADAGIVPLGTWSAPQVIPELTVSMDNDDATFSGDLLEVFFNARFEDPDVLDIYTSIRTSVGDTWGEPRRVEIAATEESESNCAITPDGLTMFFSVSVRGRQFEVYQTVRATRLEAWQTPVLVDSLNSDESDLVSYVSPNANRLLLHRRSSAPQRVSLYEATRGNSSESYSVEPLGGLNRSEEEESGYLSSDALTIYFVRDLDIHLATRPSVSDAFANPRIILDFNEGNSNEDDPWLSADGGTIYFSSDRSGTNEIYRSSLQ